LVRATFVGVFKDPAAKAMVASPLISTEPPLVSTVCSVLLPPKHPVSRTESTRSKMRNMAERFFIKNHTPFFIRIFENCIKYHYNWIISTNYYIYNMLFKKGG
jgi:hypothetical protein